MRKTFIYAALVVVAVLVGGCSSGGFWVYKDAKYFYITSSGPELKRILCDSGDMDRIARDSRLPDPLQKDLKDGICASNKVKERLMTTLEGMTKEQRTALKQAFQQNGYDINVVANC
jgi:PBP1b-binding outer membrane lipoprotein LpoB